MIKKERNYEKNKDVLLNRSKEYYINNKELIRERANNKYKLLSEDEKQKMKDYQKQYRENMTDEQKQKMKDYQKEYQKKYREGKKLNNKITASA